MSVPSFDAFETHDVQVKSEAVGDLTIRVRKQGHGPPLLLLHGYPQTSHLWNRVAPELSAKYTVVVPDLRGYGSSSKPPGSESHVEYSKREMAEDAVQVMKHFGFDTFPIVAHDRGARVAHRLALDNPGKVSKLMVLDILPTLWMYEHTDQMFATGYWHWFFLIQPTPFTENVILADTHAYWRLHTSKASHQHSPWTEHDVEVYQRDYFKPEAVHAACEDYRAASTIDLEHDRQSIAAGTKLTVPSVCVLWGQKGMIQKMAKDQGATAIWREYADQGVHVEGAGLDCGHYIPEEQPEELLKWIDRFLG